MSKFAKIILLIMSLPLVALQNNTNQEDTSPLIRSPPGQFPANVDIRNASDDNHLCTGMLVELDNVITSASCVANSKAKDLLIIAGSANLLQERNVSYILIHPDYSSTDLDYNIAVLKLRQLFNQTTHVHAAVVARLVPNDGETCFVSGWTTEKGKSVMKYARVTAMKVEQCKKCIENTVCAGNFEHKGECLGDQGSPLVCNGALHGIYVGSAANCQAYSGIYSDIVFYKEWINKLAEWDGYGDTPLPDPDARKRKLDAYLFTMHSNQM
ncbi:trypsin epsilon-like isoform X2 [Hermetia illucens]|nr:trypsin epsilon-like isoform X2 [Hermetia illucens]